MDEMEKGMQEFALVRQKRAKCESEHGNHDPLLCIVCKWKNAKDPQVKHRILNDAYQNKEDASVSEIIFMGGNSNYIRPRESTKITHPLFLPEFIHELIVHGNRDLLKAICSNDCHEFNPWGVFFALSEMNKGWLAQIQIANIIKSGKTWPASHGYYRSCIASAYAYMRKGAFTIVFTYLLECNDEHCTRMETISKTLKMDFGSDVYMHRIKPVLGIPIWESIIKDADYYLKRDRRALVFSLLCGYTHCPESPFYKDRLPRELFKLILHEAYLFVIEGDLIGK